MSEEYRPRHMPDRSRIGVGAHTCRNCANWDGHDALGTCRARPPVVNDTPSDHYPWNYPDRRWPVTHETDWCAGWMLKYSAEFKP